MISNLKAAFSQGIHEASTVQKELLGTLRVTLDGRKFRYAKAGGVLAAGKACIGAASVANHINRAADAAVAVGVTQLEQTVGATAVTENQYAGGYLDVNDATGEGYRYGIESNSAADASGTTTIQLSDPIRVDLVKTTSELSLIPNVRSGVTHSATEESVPAGIAVGVVPSGSYCWLQTGGEAIALMDSTPAVATMLTLGSVAGSLAAINATLDIDQPIFAVKTHNAGVDAEYKPIDLRID